MHHFHVLSYNIHKGMDLINRRFILDEIKKSIRAVNTDLILLQEVQGAHLGHKKKQSSNNLTSQFEFLADSLWPHYAYGKNAIYSEGHHGNAILSKYPITFYENINISNNTLEKRGLLHATIKIPKSKENLHILCVHFDLFESGRMKQVKKLCQRIKDHIPANAPLIVGGDFNDWRQKASQILLQEIGLKESFFELTGEHARTFPAAFPIFKLDRFYFKNVQLHSAMTFKDGLWKNLSDHCAIYAEFFLKTDKDSEIANPISSGDNI